MDVSEHSLTILFQQLGLPHAEDDIEVFIQRHSPIHIDIPLAEADFWTTAQAQFLKEAIADDADWAVVVEHLDSLLRG